MGRNTHEINVRKMLKEYDYSNKAKFRGLEDL